MPFGHEEGAQEEELDGAGRCGAGAGPGCAVVLMMLASVLEQRQGCGVLHEPAHQRAPSSSPQAPSASTPLTLDSERYKLQEAIKKGHWFLEGEDGAGRGKGELPTK